MKGARQAWRRVAAFGLDYLLILLYMGVLMLFSVMVLTPRLSLSAPWQTQLLGFMTLTLPVFLYFALSERFAGGTFGKRWLGLSVTDMSGSRLPLYPSLLRSALKFTPWELAHTAVHRLIFWTANGGELSLGQTLFILGFYVLSLGLAGIYLVGLFWNQPLYDRVARSRVVLAPRHIRNIRRFA